MSRKIDFGGEDWSAHRQDHWLEFAGDNEFPDYLRIVFVAYGRHRANGHARLKQGELAHYLVRTDGRLPDRRNIRHAINRAIGLRFLMPESRALCLVVSSDHIQGGVGDPNRRCDRDHTIRQKDVTEARPSARNDVTKTGRFAEKDVLKPRRSEPDPSIYLVPQPTDDSDGEVSA